MDHNKSIIMTLKNVDIIAFLYLYIPVLIFVITWTRLLFAVPVCLLIIYAVKSQCKDNAISISLKRQDIPLMMLFVCIILFWLILCGMGSFTAQTTDYAKHNYILDQLISNEWPVYCEYNGNRGMLTYYLGAYIIPSLVGKLIPGVYTSRIMTLLYAVPGVVLAFVYLYKSLKLTNKHSVFILLMCFVFFDTFANPIKDLYMFIIGDYSISEFSSFSENYALSFQSNTMSLLWAAIQVIPVWLCASMLLYNIKEHGKWGLIVMPLLFYSLFAFAGTVMFCLLLALIDFVFEKRIRILSTNNVISLLLASVGVIYYSGSVLQPKTEGAQMGFRIIAHWESPLAFIMFTLSWLVWVLLSIRHGNKKTLLGSSIVLVLISFCSLGTVNDLAVKGCMVPLFFIFANVFKMVTIIKNKTLSIILVVLILFSGFSAIAYASLNFSNGIGFDKSVYVPNDLSEFEDLYGEHVVYQYYDWQLNTIKNIVFK